jgi:hypothetical protein
MQKVAMKRIVVLSSMIFMFFSCFSLYLYRGFTFLSLKPIPDELVKVSVRRGTLEAISQDSGIGIAVSVMKGPHGATWFHVSLANNSSVVMPFKERMLSFEASDDGVSWIALPLITAAESDRYRLKEEGTTGGYYKFSFMFNNYIQPGEYYSGVVEYGHGRGEKEHRLYRLSIGLPLKIVRFLFVNTNVHSVE